MCPGLGLLFLPRLLPEAWKGGQGWDSVPFPLLGYMPRPLHVLWCIIDLYMGRRADMALPVDQSTSTEQWSGAGR